MFKPRFCIVREWTTVPGSVARTGCGRFTLEHGDLLADGEDFQGRIAASAEEDSKHPEQGKGSCFKIGDRQKNRR